ncbi:unnamed protein product [Owenia fusiformis]|uniref:Uncharacterized protein n=1 Tax=Owenia fusiformis TaxID=6347 RepID=A0A8S4PGQ5_OWEFU|nr:unnamed protein product [Owenia fusiformis]
MKLYDVALLGAGNVGKTALLHYLREETFLAEYSPTIQENYNTIVNLEDGQSLLVNILDTAGFYEFPMMRESNIRSTEAFMVVFALDDQESFEQAISIKRLIDSIKGDTKSTVLLVGNKNEASQKRRIPSEVILKAAAVHFKGNYIETNVTDGCNVLKAFQTVCRALTPRSMRSRSQSEPNKLMTYLRQKLNKKTFQKGSLELIKDNSSQVVSNEYEDILGMNIKQNATPKKPLVAMKSFSFDGPLNIAQLGLNNTPEDMINTDTNQVSEENKTKGKPKTKNVFSKLVHRISKQKLLRTKSFI